MKFGKDGMKYTYIDMWFSKETAKGKSKGNQVLISLLLSLVFLGAVSCGGGETGIEVIPELEVVEPEPTEGTQPEPESTPEPIVETIYVPTLESWGAEEGLIDVATDNAGNCVDPLLTTKQNFPVPFPRESLVKIVNGVAKLDDTNILKGDVRCTDKLFNRIARIGKWAIKPGSNIVFVKTHRSSGVVGGIMHFNYNTDSQEYKDRQELWDKCKVGTDPSPETPRDMYLGENSRGEWVATKEGNSHRFCIRLDTLPGAVKCLVTNKNSVELHSLGEITQIFGSGELVFNSPTGFTLFNQVNGQADFPYADGLCNLFDEGPRNLGPLECERRTQKIRCGLGDPDPDCRPSEDDPFGSTKLAEVLHCSRPEI